jgi:hypothetical protein
MCVLRNCLFRQGPLQRLSMEFTVKWINSKLQLQIPSVVEYGSCVKKALSCGASYLVDHPQFAHLRTLLFFYEGGDGQAITITLQCCIEIINKFLATNLPSNYNLKFQQDFSMPHTAMIDMAVLCCLFLQRVLSHLVMCYGPSFTGSKSIWLFLWGYLKSKVYSMCLVD